MTTNEITRMLLLGQSGELSEIDQKRLETMLAADASAREQAEELEKLRDTWHQATVATPLPSPSVLQRIRQAAADQAHRGETAPLIWFRLPAFRMVAAAAAMIALGASLYLTRWSPNASSSTRMAEMDLVDLQIEAALEAIDTSMLALLDDPTDDVLPGNDS